jgi:hypothetical protein
MSVKFTYKNQEWNFFCGEEVYLSVKAGSTTINSKGQSLQEWDMLIGNLRND